MKKYWISAAVILFWAGLSITANAQSPWESGGFKGYDDQQATTPGTTDGDTGAVGLQGFSLAPSTSDSAPATGTQYAPILPGTVASTQSPAVSGTASSARTASQSNQQALAAQQMQALPQGSKYAAVLNAAIQNAMGQAGDVSFVTITQKTIDTLTKASQLAQKNATPEMQKFAGQLLSIYNGMENDINGIVKANQIQITTPALQAADLSKLASLNGKNFDTSFMSLQQQQFMILSNAFKTEISSGQNADLKAYATKQLPMINQQKDMIQQSYKASMKQNVTNTLPTNLRQ